jgi:hypothetical protein
MTDDQAGVDEFGCLQSMPLDMTIATLEDLKCRSEYPENQAIHWVLAELAKLQQREAKLIKEWPRANWYGGIARNLIVERKHWDNGRTKYAVVSDHLDVCGAVRWLDTIEDAFRQICENKEQES